MRDVVSSIANRLITLGGTSKLSNLIIYRLNLLHIVFHSVDNQQISLSYFIFLFLILSIGSTVMKQSIQTIVLKFAGALADGIRIIPIRFV